MEDADYGLRRQYSGGAVVGKSGGRLSGRA